LRGFKNWALTLLEEHGLRVVRNGRYWELTARMWQEDEKVPRVRRFIIFILYQMLLKIIQDGKMAVLCSMNREIINAYKI
jgi:hypothetical protein